MMVYTTESLDKTSVRNQVEKIKNDFEHLCIDGNITSEVQAVMNSLLMTVDLVFAIFLERTTKKSSRHL